MRKIDKTLTKLNEAGYFSYRKKDFMALLLIVASWWAVGQLIQPVVTLTEFILSFGLMAFFTTFAALLIRKIGVVLLMFLSAITFIGSLPDLSGLGTTGILVMIITGLVFELLYIIFYVEMSVVPLDVILSAAFSLAAIPVLTGFFLSPALVRERILDLLNLSLLDLFIAIGGATLAFLIWFFMRTSKTVVKFEYT